jgi:hypothetical protein
MSLIGPTRTEGSASTIGGSLAASGLAVVVPAQRASRSACCVVSWLQRVPDRAVRCHEADQHPTAPCVACRPTGARLPPIGPMAALGNNRPWWRHVADGIRGVGRGDGVVTYCTPGTLGPPIYLRTPCARGNPRVEVCRGQLLRPGRVALCCRLRRSVNSAMTRSLATERRIVRPSGFRSREISPPS